MDSQHEMIQLDPLWTVVIKAAACACIATCGLLVTWGIWVTSTITANKEQIAVIKYALNLKTDAQAKEINDRIATARKLLNENKL